MTIPKYFYFRVRPKNKGTAIELEDASDVDVVEVIRCKDCKHYCVHSFFGREVGYCERNKKFSEMAMMEPGDYCSYAVMRGEA